MHLDGLGVVDTECRPVNPPLPAAGWPAGTRQDPITGLVAFPDFNFDLPEVLARCGASGYDLGIAIGDVDNLKDYVENSKSRDPSAYGHLAGCALMQRLGLVASSWFATLNAPLGCVSTFGGDEIIVVLAVERGAEAEFAVSVRELRDALLEGLPRSVSFGWAVAPLDIVDVGPTAHRDLCTVLLSSVDIALLQQKAALRSAGLSCHGFVTEAPIP